MCIRHVCDYKILTPICKGLIYLCATNTHIIQSARRRPPLPLRAFMWARWAATGRRLSRRRIPRAQLRAIGFSYLLQTPIFFLRIQKILNHQELFQRLSFFSVYEIMSTRSRILPNSKQSLKFFLRIQKILNHQELFQRSLYLFVSTKKPETRFPGFKCKPNPRTMSAGRIPAAHQERRTF